MTRAREVIASVDSSMGSRLRLFESTNRIAVYAPLWESQFKPSVRAAGKYLCSKLEGSTLIDVGGGPIYSEQREYNMYDLAGECKVDLLIDVDTQLCVPPKGRLVVAKDAATFPRRTLYLKMDALEFLAGYEGKANVVMNGVDCGVYGRQTFRALAREVERIVPKEGVAFGCDCEPLWDCRDPALWKDFEGGEGSRWKNEKLRAIWERR